jgi:hypothetical protein
VKLNSMSLHHEIPLTMHASSDHISSIKQHVTRYVIFMFRIMHTILKCMYFWYIQMQFLELHQLFSHSNMMSFSNNFFYLE